MQSQNSEVQSLPQADGDPRAVGALVSGPVRVHVETRGPAFDGLANRPLATELARSLQAQGLVAVGEVLSALDRKCMSDVVDAWTRLLSVLRLDFSPMPLHTGLWGSDPWGRLASTVIQALCHADLPTASTKWLSADAAIRGWVRSHRDGMAREMHSHTHLTTEDVLEDGPTDLTRVSYLQQQIDRYTAFAAGVR